MPSTDSLLQRVRAIMPDLAIERVERDEEGLINDVLIVDRRLVFRFAKTEEFARLLQMETRILELIRGRIGVSVPAPVHQSAGCIVYPFLPGQTLSRAMIMAGDERTQHAIAAQLGDILYRLHTTPAGELEPELPATRAPVRRDDWLDLRDKVRDKIYPLLQKYQVQWANDLLDGVLDDAGFFAYEPALIHGDLASYHILFDPGACQITGVIDFGMAGMGDAASDFGNLINIYGESFVAKMQASYPDLGRYLPRARFYAQALELEWVVRGLESGEAFWYTAHLGGARDILS